MNLVNNGAKPKNPIKRATEQSVCAFLLHNPGSRGSALYRYFWAEVSSNILRYEAFFPLRGMLMFMVSDPEPTPPKPTPLFEAHQQKLQGTFKPWGKADSELPENGTCCPLPPVKFTEARGAALQAILSYNYCRAESTQVQVMA